MQGIRLNERKLDHQNHARKELQLRWKTQPTGKAWKH